jgi:hypothetical protein
MPPEPPAKSADRSRFSGPPAIQTDQSSRLKDTFPEDHSDLDQLFAERELRQLLLEIGTFLSGVERFLLRAARELKCEHIPGATQRPHSRR